MNEVVVCVCVCVVCGDVMILDVFFSFENSKIALLGSYYYVMILLPYWIRNMML